MRISLDDLKKYAVETVTSQKIGKVQDVIIDTNGQLVAQYVVKSPLIHRKTYLVGRDQVVRFEEKKLIVDSTVRAEDAKKMNDQKGIPNPEPVTMREV